MLSASSNGCAAAHETVATRTTAVSRPTRGLRVARQTPRSRRTALIAKAQAAPEASSGDATRRALLSVGAAAAVVQMPSPAQAVSLADLLPLSPGSKKAANVPPPENLAYPPTGVEHTLAGIYSEVLEPGNGVDFPNPQDTVTVDYVCWDESGKVVEGTMARGPDTLPLKKLVRGFSEGTQLMSVGEKRRMWIPPRLLWNHASGHPQDVLVFEVSLKDIERGPTIPPTPENLTAPPAEAVVTDSGLASVVVQEGSGEPGKTGFMHPTQYDHAVVSYTGWDKDGFMFDTTYVARSGELCEWRSCRPLISIVTPNAGWSWSRTASQKEFRSEDLLLA